MLKFRKFFLKLKNTQVERENRAPALLLLRFTKKAIKDEGGWLVCQGHVGKLTRFSS